MFSWSRNIIKLNKYVNMSFLMVLLAHGVAAIAPNIVPGPYLANSIQCLPCKGFSDRNIFSRTIDPRPQVD